MKQIFVSIVLGAVSLMVPACGDTPIEIPDRTPTPIDSATVGTIRGAVRFDGEIPESGGLALGGFPGCMIQHDEPLSDDSVLVREGRLANVFIHIRAGLEGKTFAVPSEPAVFDQRGCLYVPHVLGVQRYQPVQVLNSDTLLHNVHATAEKQDGFNFGQPVAGMVSVVQFQEEEVMVSVKCDVHGWMKAYIGVVDHPYFAVSTADGEFQLPNVPPGTYTLEAWHEVFGTRTAEITVGDSEHVVVDFSFSS
jgi:hypothetical protein